MNLPNFGVRVDFCPILWSPNIVLTMAMSWGRTLEGVQSQGPFGLCKWGVQMDSRFSGLRGIA